MSSNSYMVYRYSNVPGVCVGYLVYVHINNPNINTWLAFCFQVVMEAPMSLLKRSLHCLMDLQDKFEEHMDSTTVRYS